MGRTLRTEMNDAFFEYAGSELAVIEITAGLRQLDEEKGFSASFVDNYGYPVWNESKIIPIDSEEALVVLPVKSRHENKIPALWIFLAHDNVVSNVVLTKEMGWTGNGGLIISLRRCILKQVVRNIISTSLMRTLWFPYRKMRCRPVPVFW